MPKINDILDNLDDALQTALDGMGGSYYTWSEKCKPALSELRKYRNKLEAAEFKEEPIELSALHHEDTCSYKIREDEIKKSGIDTINDYGCNCRAELYSLLNQYRDYHHKILNNDLKVLPKITTEEAEEVGAKGGDVSEEERELFESWMKGHCWKVGGIWNGRTYMGENENGFNIDPQAMLTRQLWAAWRDRAHLNKKPKSNAYKGPNLPIINNINFANIYFNWSWDDVGFGETYIQSDKEGNITIDAETMSEESTKKLLVAFINKLLKDGDLH